MEYSIKDLDIIKNIQDTKEKDYIYPQDSLFGYALRQGDKKLIKPFFDRNVNIEMKGKDGESVLTLVNKYDNDLVQFIIEQLKKRKGGEKYIKSLDFENR